MKIRVVFRVVVCVLLFALVDSAAKVEAGQGHSRRPFKIGVLASLMGSGSSLGKNTVAALEIAADQIETATRGRTRFRLLFPDTHHIPPKALDTIKALDTLGRNILLRP